MEEANTKVFTMSDGSTIRLKGAEALYDRSRVGDTYKGREIVEIIRGPLDFIVRRNGRLEPYKPSLGAEG